MRKWFNYNLNNSKKNYKDRFKYTNKLLVKNKSVEKYFNYDDFKRLTYEFKSFKFLQDQLKRKHRVLFVGSGWAFTELFLSNAYRRYKDRTKLAKETNNEMYFAAL